MSIILAVKLSPSPEEVPDFDRGSGSVVSDLNLDTYTETKYEKRVMPVPIFTHSWVHYLGLMALLIMSISTLLCRRRSSSATDANRGRGPPVPSWVEALFLPLALNQSISDASSAIKEVECSKQFTRSTVITDVFEQASMRLAFTLWLYLSQRPKPEAE